MTTITYTAVDHHIKIKLEGHAGYASQNDVVCAGISTLTYTLINFLDDKITEGKIRNLSYSENPGDIEIEFELIDFPEWAQVCDFLLTGYAMISEHFPDNAALKKVGHIIC